MDILDQTNFLFIQKLCKNGLCSGITTGRYIFYAHQFNNFNFFYKLTNTHFIDLFAISMKRNNLNEGKKMIQFAVS